jgi:subtilisin-like proprotein convertase family protein
MNKKLHLFFVCLFFMGLQMTVSQEILKNEPMNPIKIEKPTKVEKKSSLAERRSSWKIFDPSEKTGEIKDGRYRQSKLNVVIGKGSTGDDVLAKNPNKRKNSIPTRSPELIFETASSSVSGSRPSDPSGAVGPNHYFAVTNTAFQIFDKDGNSLTGGLLGASEIFSPGDCCDLTATYDNDADRWVLSILVGAGAGFRVAVSEGPDPINDGWTVYTLPGNDYNKLSVWRDGYYLTDNNASTPVKVIERDAMIDGDPNTVPEMVTFALPGLATSGFHSSQVLNISNGDWPTSGGATVVFLQDDAYSGITEDHIKLWTIDMDWSDPNNSTVSAAQELGAADGVTPFVSVFDGGSFANLSQPNGGTSIDALQAIIMNQAQYRRFPTYNSALINFVVDVDGSSAKQAGVRWYELRQTADGQPWTIHQEGTYTAPDNRHAWNASMIMDIQGNIGMGYTSMSSPNSTDDQVFAGSYYTGRFSNDPLGTMTISEEVIRLGNGNFLNDRYGDYSKIDVDPENDKKFWFINELVDTNVKNVAATFQIAPNFNDDIGVISIDSPISGALSANQIVTVTIFNFGENPASTFNVTYQIDGNPIVTEAYTGTAIASGESSSFTFATQADLSVEGQVYSITASTDYSADEDNGNDTETSLVTHIFTNDIGVTAITSPVSAEDLTNEQVTITIENFGTAAHSNFDVSYTINGGTPVVEQVPGPLVASAASSYTFSTLADLSTDGTYTLEARTQLSADSDNSNDSMQVEIVNSACNSYTNDTDMTVGPNAGTVTTSVINITEDVVITDVNVTLNIEHTWDADLDVFLIAPDGTTRVELFTDVGGIAGMDFTNTVLDDDASTLITDGSAPFTGSFRPEGSLADFNGLSSMGDWTLEITDDANQDGGTLLDWTIQVCASPALSIDDETLNGEFKIRNLGNDQFEIVLTSDTLLEDLDLNVFNMLGQNLKWQTLKNEGGEYKYTLNMSYAASGIYLIRLGNTSSGVTKRIVVE